MIRKSLYETKDNIALISFNRPQALNALSQEVNIRLIEAFNRAEQEAEIKVVVLTGTGEKAFVAGADIKEMHRLDPPGISRSMPNGRLIKSATSENRSSQPSTAFALAAVWNMRWPAISESLRKMQNSASLKSR
ncbi:MAG TPA: enoyl-CoA hydratase/isomerase family protein [Smithellaceae bacterium]|nr:enoyl-CoA hydratase/isomerase family protein [Smithellaceae bacterium]